MAIKAGLKIAITTFSSQIELIHQFLKQIFTDEIAIAIPIEGWNSRQNKNMHITKIMKIYDEQQHRKFENSQVVLIDDDKKNVKAVQNGIHSIHLDPDNPNGFLEIYLLS